MIRVAAADDHAIVRAGVKALLAGEADMQLVAEASNADDAIALASKQGIDVFLVDLAMPGTDGISTIARMRACAPDMRVLVLSMHATPEFVRPALRAGAHGYVVKGSGLDDLVIAIRTVFAGDRFLDPVAEAALDQLADMDPRNAARDELDRLTPREREVLRLIALGNTNRSIGTLLGLSPKTVDAHRTNLMRKLGLHDAQALTRFALRRGLVDG